MQTSRNNCKDISLHRRQPPPDVQNQKPPAEQQRRREFPPSEQELRLAAVAIRLNVRVRTSDMPVSIQEHALRYTRSLFGNTSAALSATALARALKKEFDGKYGPAWHCVVGKSFGSFVTHSAGGFLYFSMDSLSFLLFKTEVLLVKN